MIRAHLGDSDYEGEYLPVQRVIRISYHIEPGSQLWKETLLHELIHAFYHLSGFTEPEHPSIVGLSAAIVRNLN